VEQRGPGQELPEVLPDPERAASQIPGREEQGVDGEERDHLEMSSPEGDILDCHDTPHAVVQTGLTSILYNIQHNKSNAARNRSWRKFFKTNPPAKSVAEDSDIFLSCNTGLML
jgi:hypothetical protein